MDNIFLIRHGESAANADKSLHGTIADHDIPLSELGKRQATAAGVFMNTFLKDHGITSARMWNSPYRRTRQTAKNILKEIGIHSTIDQRENNRLCEQQFGLFDGYDDDEWETVFPNEGKHYNLCKDQGGLYWARMPMGESRFDVGNRVNQAFGTFHRDSDKHGIRNIIVICHGITLRAFVQEWLHLSPEWFDAEKNPDNCWIRHLRNDHGQWSDRGYIFTGNGAELWAKNRNPVISSPCDQNCMTDVAVIGSHRICKKCLRTEYEVNNWEWFTTQQRSRIFADLTIREFNDYL